MEYMGSKISEHLGVAGALAILLASMIAGGYFASRVTAELILPLRITLIWTGASFAFCGAWMLMYVALSPFRKEG